MGLQVFKLVREGVSRDHQCVQRFAHTGDLEAELQRLCRNGVGRQRPVDVFYGGLTFKQVWRKRADSAFNLIGFRFGVVMSGGGQLLPEYAATPQQPYVEPHDPRPTETSLSFDMIFSSYVTHLHGLSACRIIIRPSHDYASNPEDMDKQSRIAVGTVVARCLGAGHFVHAREDFMTSFRPTDVIDNPAFVNHIEKTGFPDGQSSAALERLIKTLAPMPDVGVFADSFSWGGRTTAGSVQSETYQPKEKLQYCFSVNE